MLHTFSKASNQKNENLNINLNNYLELNQFKKQYLSSKLFFNDATLSKINSTSLTNFAISLPFNTMYSLFNQYFITKNKKISYDNLSQHCEDYQEKKQTLEKQLINTQKKLIEIEEIIQKVEVMTNFFLKNEKMCKNLVANNINIQSNKKKIKNS